MTARTPPASLHPPVPSACVGRRWISFALWAAALNAPFLLVHPDDPLIAEPAVRSLLVMLVLFVVPALPVMSWLSRKGRLPPAMVPFWTLAVSTAAFLGVLVAGHVLGIRPSGGTLWNGIWMVTNAGLATNIASGLEPLRGIRFSGRRLLLPCALFLAAYGFFFLSATRVVPAMADQDDEVQGTAYALIMYLKPGLRTSRDTEHHFAHPPLLHMYVAASITFHGLLDRMAIYDPQSYPTTAVEAGELYTQNPYRAETRAPNIFLAALTVVLLALFGTRLTHKAWLATLVAVVYATTPDVMVRSSYGGYYAISAFLLLQMLVAAEDWHAEPSRSLRVTCLFLGGFAAWADHKMVLLPAAIVLWGVLRARTRRDATAAMLHPLAIGFAMGTALYWAYGLSISAHDFWMDHVRHHFFDRIVHNNARDLDLSEYPSLAVLWSEFLRHTSYLLLPAGALATAWLCRGRGSGGGVAGESPKAGWRSTWGIWATWGALTAIVFSLVDWRQTKHLAPLTLLLFVALLRVSRKHPSLPGAIGALLLLLLAFNIQVVTALVRDFAALPAVPDW